MNIFPEKHFEYFIGQKDTTKGRPLYIFLTKMSANKRNLIKLNVCLFLIKNETFLEKHNEIWKNASNVIKKESDSQRKYNQYKFSR